MKAIKIGAAVVLVGLIVAGVYGWVSVRPRLENEFVLVNATGRHFRLARLKAERQSFDLGPVPPGGRVRIGLPIGITNSLDLVAEDSDGNVFGGSAGHLGDVGRLFGKRADMVVSESGFFSCTADK